MKKILLVFILGAAGLCSLALAGLSFIGITPAYIASAPAVATGIGAKLLCSSRYVSGFSKAQSFEDLVQYSGILDELTISYDEEETRVRASFFGLGEKSSTFIPGVGCSIDYAGFDIRSALAELVRTPDINVSDSAATFLWPRSDQVTTIDPQIQALIDTLVIEDNTLGLNTRALLVVKGGKILGEAYAQGADASTPLLGWSMAKSLTAVMLASLEYRGLLDLSADPCDRLINDDRWSRLFRRIQSRRRRYGNAFRFAFDRRLCARETRCTSARDSFQLQLGYSEYFGASV